MEDVRVEYLSDCREDLASFQDNFLLVAEELSNSAPDHEGFRRLLNGASAELEASKRGVAITNTPIMIVGRMPTV